MSIYFLNLPKICSAGVQKPNEQTLAKKVDLAPEMNSAACPLRHVTTAQTSADIDQ